MKTTTIKVVAIGCIGLAWGALPLSAPAADQKPVVVARQDDIVLPQPNAYDYFVRAGKALNGAKKSLFEMTPEEQEKHLENPPAPPGTKPTVEGIRQQAEWNAEALRILRQGFAYEYRSPAVGTDMDFTYHARMRQLARLLMAESQRFAEQKQWKQAADSSLDAIRLGIEIPRGQPVIGALVGFAVESIGRRSLWDIVNQMDAASARHASHRLEPIESRRNPFAAMLHAEWQTSEAFRREAVQEANDPRWTGEKVAGAVARLMETEIDKAQQPYITAQQRPTLEVEKQWEEIQKEWEENKTLPAQKLATMNQIELAERVFIPSRYIIYTTRSQDTRNRALNSLLIVALALRAYQVENQKYPASLSEVVPGYLEQIPTDPFSLKNPLHYRLKGAEYSLYSIGPDGADNGGVPIGDGKAVNVVFDSKGDIVAGVNLR